MTTEKNYKSFTGLTDFYYGVLDETTNKIKDEKAERIKFLQNISISTGQELVKAHGDNTIAEMAVSTDSTTLTTTFHKLPIEDRAKIYGLISKEELYGLPASPQPPYVACMFTRTAEDGSTEHIGFTKGKFTLADVEGETKGESVDFGSDEAEGEFMPRKVEGFDEEVTYLIAADEPGETTNRDKLYEKIFGVEYPRSDNGEGVED